MWWIPLRKSVSRNKSHFEQRGLAKHGKYTRLGFLQFSFLITEVWLVHLQPDNAEMRPEWRLECRAQIRHLVRGYHSHLGRSRALHLHHCEGAYENL